MMMYEERETYVERWRGWGENGRGEGKMGQRSGGMRWRGNEHEGVCRKMHYGDCRHIMTN